MRERGTQSRRLRPGPPDRGRHTADNPGGSRLPPPASSEPRLWQIIAIVAIILATAGWTAAAMLAMRGPSQTETPSDIAAASDDLGLLPSDDTSIPPLDLTHDVPELEPLLPKRAKDTPLVTMSWTGDAIFSDDGFEQAPSRSSSAARRRRRPTCRSPSRSIPTSHSTSSCASSAPTGWLPLSSWRR